MTRIAVLDDYQNVALQSADWSAVRARAEVVVFDDHVDNSDMLVERLLPFDAVCVMRERTPLGEEILQRLPNLKFIGSNAPHNASIALGAAKERGIVVSFTGGRGNGAPELTWALILAAARHIQAETGSFRSGGWQAALGSDLEGATLGVMGLGKIGTRMARIGRAFGMKVIAWSENLTAQVAHLLSQPEASSMALRIRWPNQPLILLKCSVESVHRRSAFINITSEWY